MPVKSETLLGGENATQIGEFSKLEAKKVLFSEFEKRGMHKGWYENFLFLQEAIRRESNWNINAIGKNKNSKDWGLCQINDRSWDKVASNLGLDYKNNWRDNLIMCVEVLYKQGRGAWVSMKYK
jgi:hypothetical protein